MCKCIIPLSVVEELALEGTPMQVCGKSVKVDSSRTHPFLEPTMHDKG